jgi:hypothetical protein
MKAVLIRQYNDKNTTGELSLYHGDILLYRCKTVELPWKDNEPQVSCIPEATYNVSVVAATDKIKYRHLWVENVPKRSGIKIHVANYTRQLRGCIAPGISHADIDKDGIMDVTSSTKAMADIMAVVDKEGKHTFPLTIKTL